MLDLRRKGSKKKGNTEEEGLLREGKWYMNYNWTSALLKWVRHALPSSQLQQVHLRPLERSPGANRPCTSRAQIIFSRQKKNNYLSIWYAITRLTRVVKETFFGLRERKQMQCISRISSVMPDHQLKASNQLPGLAPSLGGERRPCTMWNETNEVFSAGEEWETLLTASSTDWWNSSPRETVQRLFWLFNEVWLSFNPSDSVLEVFCECLRSCFYPWAHWLLRDFLNHIPCNGFLSCCMGGHLIDRTNSSYSEVGIGTKPRSPLQTLGTRRDLNEVGKSYLQTLPGEQCYSIYQFLWNFLQQPLKKSILFREKGLVLKLSSRFF